MEEYTSEEVVLTAKDIVESEPVEPGKKRYRVIAGIIDIVLVVLAAIGLTRLMLLTPLGTRFNNNRHMMQSIEDTYKLVEYGSGENNSYGYKYYSYEDNYDNEKKGHVIHSDENGEYIVLNRENISEEIVKNYKSLVSSDQTYMKIRKETQIIIYSVMAFSSLVSEAIFLFAIPLTNKRKASIGKLLFNLSLVSFDVFEEPKWWQILLRTIVVFIVGTILLIFLSQWAALALPILILIEMFFGPRHRTFHDLIARTYVIDERSYNIENIRIYMQTRRDISND